MATARKMDKVHGRLTKTDIKNGIGHHPKQCPIGRCLHRQFPKSKIHVFTFQIEIDEHRYKHTVGTESFIKDFDSNKPVKPIKFTLTKV